VWEEPLAEERAAVLDAHFEDISVEPVASGEGWHRIEALPCSRTCSGPVDPDRLAAFPRRI
jgi:hypothetical protein